MKYTDSNLLPPSPYNRMKKMEKRSCVLQKETQTINLLEEQQVALECDSQGT